MNTAAKPNRLDMHPFVVMRASQPDVQIAIIVDGVDVTSDLKIGTVERILADIADA